MRMLVKSFALGLILLSLTASLDNLLAQQLATVDLCGPGTGLQGTNWLSLPSFTDLLTAEQICAAIPNAQSVTQRYPDTVGTYTYNCLSTACTNSSGGVSAPEPGTCGSSCFCVSPGEGYEVRPSAAALGVPINGCDEFVPLGVPFFSGAGTTGTLVSVPYRTFLTTFDDLGNYFGLPNSGLSRGTVTSLDCATGALVSVQVGTAAAAAALLVPGKAYRLRSPNTALYTATNPVACTPPNPLPAACPVGGIMVNNVGGITTITWNVPAGCPLTLDYQVARIDLSCLGRQCERCAGCSILTAPTTPITSFSEPTPAGGPWGYWVRVLGGTWNEAGLNLCIDRDYLMSLGCP